MLTKGLPLLLMIVFSQLSTAQNNPRSNVESVITGIVLNEDDEPVQDANACLSNTKGNNTLIRCNAKTDKNGRFRIAPVEPGSYHVYAIKESDGYSIENQAPGQKVEIAAGDDLELTVRLRGKGGILFGTVTDKSTGRPINGAEIHIFAIDNGAGGGSNLINGKFELTVPADSDLVILVTARGYKGWIFTGSFDPARPVLRAASGERKELNIQLEPLPDASQ